MASMSLRYARRISISVIVRVCFGVLFGDYQQVIACLQSAFSVGYYEASLAADHHDKSTFGECDIPQGIALGEVVFG